jgi:hypothetical protein
VVALAAFAPTLAGTNNLTQIGIAQHSGGPDTLRQIGIALHDGGTYLAGDGSVRTIPGDGSVRLISIGGGTQEAFCFHNVQTVGTIQDGTSNTIFLGEDVGLAVVPTSTSGLAPVRGILDGTSNTITFPESTNFCMGGVTDVDVVPGGDLAGATTECSWVTAPASTSVSAAPSYRHPLPMAPATPSYSARPGATSASTTSSFRAICRLPSPRRRNQVRWHCCCRRCLV